MRALTAFAASPELERANDRRRCRRTSPPVRGAHDSRRKRPHVARIAAPQLGIAAEFGSILAVPQRSLDAIGMVPRAYEVRP